MMPRLGRLLLIGLIFGAVIVLFTAAVLATALVAFGGVR